MSPQTGPSHLSGGLAETIPIQKSLAKRARRLYTFSICFFLGFYSPSGGYARGGQGSGS